TVFTTHTPVPAGIDRFPVDLVRHYLDGDDGGSSRMLPGLGVDEVLALGGEDDPGRFNMAHMGLRLAQRANGVAKLHGKVSGNMADWHDLASAETWPSADRVSRDRLWHLRNTLRRRLVELARATARKSQLQRGATIAELEWTESILDPDI